MGSVQVAEVGIGRQAVSEESHRIARTCVDLSRGHGCFADRYAVICPDEVSARVWRCVNRFPHAPELRPVVTQQQVGLVIQGSRYCSLASSVAGTFAHAIPQNSAYPGQWSLPCTAPIMPSIHWRGWTQSPGSCDSPTAAAPSVGDNGSCRIHSYNHSQQMRRSDLSSLCRAIDL